MKKFFEGILVLILIFSLTGCSNGHTPSTDSDNSKAIYESTISPNEEYIEKDEDKVFYTIKVYQEDTGIKLAIAVVTISLNGEIISERKVSFVGNTIDIIIDTIEQN